LLNRVFTACHPVLSPDARVALTLRVVGGLTTEEIAGAFLVPESTAAQRIVRAKKALAKAGVRFETPPDEQRAERLGSVLGVLYLIFNEGYSATGGAHLVRPDLCATALRLGRVLVSLVPREPEAHGLLALMELQASRIRARTSPVGAPVRLLDQDRSRWDRLLITRGLAGLERAERLGGGPYTAQAAIAACHARAATAEDTDWVRVVGLYELLALRTPSPVIALNHAVACGMAFGPEVGLELVDELLGEKALAGYHLLPSARGDLLARLGRTGEARAEFERAAALTRNEPERAQLLARARECG
ncbi:RNA polymerase sigma factor, partial [Actinosynnema sp.]|uniref:RNA polymerase sigma factor n=1 Tax=Actinosynnema sp. TaxID=1872144 RepID=UPI003F8447EA